MSKNEDNNPKLIDLRQLLSACISLSNAACAIIRNVQQSREHNNDDNNNNNNNHNDNDNRNSFVAILKDPTDTRSYLTVADQRAQQVIVDGLLGEWPELSIVAEEEEREEGWIVPVEYTTCVRKDALDADLHYFDRTRTMSTTTMPTPTPIPTTDATKKDLDYLQPLQDVCVFIDPVDGTREFVEGRLLSCQCLIGIALRGKSVGGVMGLPFHNNNDTSCGGSTEETTTQTVCQEVVSDPPSSASGVVIYALGDCVRGLEEVVVVVDDDDDDDDDEEERQVISATSVKVNEDAVQQAQQQIDSFTNTRTTTTTTTTTMSTHHIIAGGCGNKILQLLTGAADVTLFNLGTSVWDTCATEAILHATGGRMTNLFGWPMDHQVTSPRANTLGVLATSGRWEARTSVTHAMLVERMVQQPAVRELVVRQYGYDWKTTGASSSSSLHSRTSSSSSSSSSSGSSSVVPSHALDICRTLAGQPFTASYLGDIVCGKNGGSAAVVVQGYTAPESEAVRYKQSHACRIHLHFRQRTSNKNNNEDDEEDEEDDETPTPDTVFPRSVFCKRIVLRELPYAVRKATMAPFKLARDVRANGVEAAFLQSAALKAFVTREVEAVRSARRTTTMMLKAGGSGSGKGGTGSGDMDGARIVDAGNVRGSTWVPPSSSFPRKGCVLPIAVQGIIARAAAKRTRERAAHVNDDTNTDDRGGSIQVATEVGLPYTTEAISYPSHPIDSRFLLLLFDFTASLGWEQRPLLQSRVELYATLQALARFHAFFWIGKKKKTTSHTTTNDTTNDKTEGWGTRLARENVIWDTGSYWDLGKLRPNILDEIQPKWTRIMTAFQTVFHDDHAYLCMKEEEMRSLGTRLHAMAPEVCWRTHGQHADGTKGGSVEETGGGGGEVVDDDGEVVDERCYTVLHGDPKAANFFYNRSTMQHGGIGKNVSAGPADDDTDVRNIGVGMIDFQWTGVGLPSTDIAYCLAASASGLLLDRDMESLEDEPVDGVGELRCLRYYHTCLLQALVEDGVVDTVEEGECILPYEKFRRQFQEAMVDLFRTVVTDWWTAMTPTLLEEREGAMAYNACNKSMHTALWLIKYTAACLRRLEAVDVDVDTVDSIYTGAHL